MRKISFLLLSLFSFHCLFGLDIQRELEEIRQLQQKAKSQRIALWLGFGITSLVAAKFLGERAEVFEKELNDKWFWNPQTQQEETPPNTDQTTGTLYYWSGKTATVAGYLSLIWGIKQAIYVGGIRAFIKLKESLIETELQRDEWEHQRAELRRQREAREEWERQQAEWKSQQDTYGRARQKQSTPAQQLRSYYEILRIDRTATTAQIKKAYQQLAREYHPSTNNSARDLNATERSKREAIFKEISDAWGTLQDAQLKTAYDTSWSYLNEDQRRNNVTLAIQNQTRKRQVEAEAEAKLKAVKDAAAIKKSTQNL